MSRDLKATSLDPSRQPCPGRDQGPSSKFRQGGILYSPQAWFPGSVICPFPHTSLPLDGCLGSMREPREISSVLFSVNSDMPSTVQAKLQRLFVLPIFRTKRMPSPEVPMFTVVHAGYRQFLGGGGRV